MKNRVKKFENGIEVIERFDYLKTSQVLYSFLDQLQNVPCHCIPSQITREGGVTEVTSFFFLIADYENSILNCLFQDF